MADIFGLRETGEKGRSVLESRSAGAKLGSAVIGELLGNEACKKAVLAFLEGTGVGNVKAGAFFLPLSLLHIR